jgi:hypothetical protein
MNLVRSIFLIIFLAIVIIGCQESEIPDSFSLFKRVHLFDDSLANPAFYFEKIASSHDRMLMTYGHGSPNDPVPQGIYYMITDNEGNVIKKDSMGYGLTFHALQAAPDGSFVLMATSSVYSTVYYLHIDANGNQAGVDSTLLPLGYGYFSSGLSLQGNIIICAGGDNSDGMIMECDFNGKLIWSRHTALPLSYGLRSSDNSYLFVYNDIDSTFKLFKTNSVGEPVWSKTFHTPFFPLVSCFSENGNGNYRFCVNDTDTWDKNPNAPNALRVYEVNPSGDSVNRVNVNKTVVNFGGAMIQKNDEHTLILLNVFYNQFGFGRPTIPARQNTHYVILGKDLEIVDQGELQNQSNDLCSAVVKNSDGRIACYGLIQSFEVVYFKPVLFLAD